MLKEAAHVVRDLLQQLHKVIKPGINELDIASFCENYMIIRNVEPVLKSGGYCSSAVHISRNNIAFHGIPSDSVLKDGDIVTVDVVLRRKGWHGDGAWTYKVGQCSEQASRLVDFSKNLVARCIGAIDKECNISAMVPLIKKECELKGFRVLEEGAGHGIGLILHEDPQILYNSEAQSIPLKEGMVFTIEPVFTDSFGNLSYSEDGVAAVEKGFATSQFEHMVAVNRNGLDILTGRHTLFT